MQSTFDKVAYNTLNRHSTYN